MTTLVLKIIALTAMLIDHIGVVLTSLYPDYAHILILFRAVGRLAWPIFAYLLAEGFRHTMASDNSLSGDLGTHFTGDSDVHFTEQSKVHSSERKGNNRSARFLMRLLAFAFISQIPFALVFGNEISFTATTNIFYTLFLGGMAIFLYEKYKKRYDWQTMAVIAAILPMATLAEILTADYGGLGVCFIFVVYLVKPKMARLIAVGIFALSQFIPLVMAYFWSIDVPTEYLLMIPFALAAVPLIALYNGERGKHGKHGKHGTRLKWLFYWFYPAHLAVLAVIAVIINGSL